MIRVRHGDLELALYIGLVQLVISLLLAGALMLINPVTSSAALAGGLTGLLASACFALICLRSDDQRSAAKIVVDFYLAQAAKWIVVVVSMAISFIYLPAFDEGIDEGINVLALFGAFLLTQSAYIAVPVFLKKT
ncbi:MAG: hypothetical protein DRR06_02435 [Gammaproteobacteria bacterium]|nr:MAG: hypothetical protein DRR06_02435 [Gammaproteobacteria bacterium]RLA54241.1 MAG: hypothetical protein DRR42_02460 [Gammaproteobacteria bacterium]